MHVHGAYDHVSAVLMKANRGRWIPGSWNYRWFQVFPMWMLETEFWAFSNALSNPQHPVRYFKTNPRNDFECAEGCELNADTTLF